MKTQFVILLLYYVITNTISFALMGIDKKKAIHHRWRISENTLFFWGIISGGLGALLGMRFFHHKTKRWYFVVGMRFLLLLHIVIIGMSVFVF